jgi:UDP-galactopyranose mutase
VPRPENAALFKRYEALADAAPNVHFVGRLATYRYYNMDQVVGQSLATFARIEKTVPKGVAAASRPALVPAASPIVATTAAVSAARNGTRASAAKG